MNSPTSWMKKSPDSSPSIVLSKPTPPSSLPFGLDSTPRMEKRGSCGPTDKVLLKARITAKRASIVMLEKAVGDNGGKGANDRNGEARDSLGEGELFFPLLSFASETL